MPLKDKEKRNEYQRLLMRRRRSAAKGEVVLDEPAYQEFRMQEAEDLRAIVEEAIELLRDDELDKVVRARAIFQGAQVAIKLLELTDLAKRVKELEAAAKEKQEGSWKDSQF